MGTDPTGMSDDLSQVSSNEEDQTAWDSRSDDISRKPIHGRRRSSFSTLSKQRSASSSSARRWRSATRRTPDLDSKETGSVLARCNPFSRSARGSRRFFRDEALAFSAAETSDDFARLFASPKLICVEQTIWWFRRFVEEDMSDLDALDAMRNMLRLHQVLNKVSRPMIRVVQGFVLELCQALTLRWTRHNSPTILERYSEEAASIILGLLGLYRLVADQYTKAEELPLLSKFVEDKDEVNASVYLNRLIELTESAQPVIALLTILSQLSVNGLDHHLIAFYLLRACGLVSEKPKCRVRLSEADLMTSLERQDTSIFASELKSELQRILGIDLFVYGSAYTGLGDVVSDTDICLLVQDLLKSPAAERFLNLYINLETFVRDISRDNSHLGRSVAQELCASIKEKLSDLPIIRNNPVCVETILNARKPIITITNIQDNTSVDICIATDAVGICNSVLLRHYARMDQRFVSLTLLVKQWSKARLINGAYRGHLSSYAITLTVLNFLIHAGVLSNIQMPSKVAQCLDYSRPFEIDSETLALDPRYADCENMPWSNYKSRNNDNVADLLRDYFSFMTHSLDWNEDLVSPRCAPFVMKKSVLLRRSFRRELCSPGRQIDATDTFTRKATAGDTRIHQNDYDLRLPFCCIIKTHPTPRDSVSWIYEHRDHQSFSARSEQGRDAYEGALCIECPVENHRILSARSENASLFAELWRAWICLTYDNAPVKKLCRPFPAPDNGFSSCCMRLNMWRQLPPFNIKPRQELTEAYARYGCATWASLERLENAMRFSVAPQRARETPVIESICRPQKLRGLTQKQKRELEAKASAARANINLLRQFFPNQSSLVGAAEALEELEAVVSKNVDIRNADGQPGNNQVLSPKARKGGIDQHTNRNNSLLDERVLTKAIKALSLVKAEPVLQRARSAPKRVSSERRRRRGRGRTNRRQGSGEEVCLSDGQENPELV